MSSVDSLIHRADQPLCSLSTSQRRSRFTFRHLAQLRASSTTCPLRVIAHIDLDAFYAQCEMVRLGVPESQPLAVQQWQGLIAINYPARDFGLSRHVPITDAKRLCPHIICQHVATWKEGEEKWAYHEDAASHIDTHKVSLDPYRLESRKILACIKNALPSSLQKVEKAGIDEVFLDLSAQIHSILLERYPELTEAPYDDPTELLPLPPTTALNWQADALIDLDEAEREEDDPDWDDIVMLIAAEIVRSVRAAIRDELKYTCSGGISRNKMLAKLGSGYKKPNQQTVIRNRAVQKFLEEMKFTKIRNLGGKLGEQVVALFKTDSVKELLAISMDQLKQKLGDDTGIWVYNTIRGIDLSEVSSRTQIKSMLSAKSFRPTITTRAQAISWIRIFVADIFSRLVEEGVLENKRRPRTINLHHRHGGQTKSRQTAIPQGKIIDEEMLFSLTKTLFEQILSEGNVWPCHNLSLSIGGFEDGITGNMGIGAFLVRGAEAETTNAALRETYERPEKRRRIEGQGISKFFTKGEEKSNQIDGSRQGSEELQDMSNDAYTMLSYPDGTEKSETLHQSVIDTTSLQLDAGGLQYSCRRCGEMMESEDALQSHNDWHLARDIQDEENASAASAQRRGTQPSTSKKPKGPSSAGKRPGQSTKVEKGQSKLRFG